MLVLRIAAEGTTFAVDRFGGTDVRVGEVSDREAEGAAEPPERRHRGRTQIPLDLADVPLRQPRRRRDVLKGQAGRLARRPEPGTESEVRLSRFT